MFKITNKERLAKDITKIVVEAPLIAKKAKAGQFVVVINDDKGERIPLTMADWDRQRGIITLILQDVGFTTHKLAAREIGNCIAHILGPLGHATEIKKLGQVICIGGGVGIAEILPVAGAFKQAGNDVVSIIGARNKELLILEEEMRAVCNELYITTDDGSYGRKGFVTELLKEILDGKTDKRANRQTHLIYAVGPIVMMRAVSDLTRPFRIKTIVSLNTIMVDATGMCGSCRCSVGDQAKFACVDGPDFDGHLVNFQELGKRVNQFKAQEQIIRDTL
ncbi:MAG: sulfide/dihydroorotate dehydrogenase-like FAD/NAD-binding protein [Candidatus Omnitrophica bacterium]|nr:sulfide/dihydroorotate dehydrogenase-like FAD/NAD-binding protein [Candidatus Omnitrophota bacterium]